MDRVAKETGGQHIDAEATHPETYFRQIAEELRSSYELAYYPSNPIQDDAFRKIAIRPKMAGITVRSRTGYFSRSADGGQFTKESWQPQAQRLSKEGYRVVAFDFRGFGKSHGPGDSDVDTAPMQLDVLAAVRYLRSNGAKTVVVIGGSFGGGAAADASIASQPGEIDRLILLAAEGNGPAERIKAPLLEIVARDDANHDGPRLPHIRVWFDKVPQPKELIVLDGSAHAQFLFQTEQAERVMAEILTFLHSAKLSSHP